jgi:hypothetical protein
VRDQSRSSIVGQVWVLVLVVGVCMGCSSLRVDDFGGQGRAVYLRIIESWEVVEAQKVAEGPSYFCPPSCGMTFKEMPFYVFFYDGKDMLKWKTNSNMGQVVVSPRATSSVIQEGKKDVVLDQSRTYVPNRGLPGSVR